MRIGKTGFVRVFWDHRHPISKRDGLSSYRESSGNPARKVEAREPRPLQLIIVAFAKQLAACETFRVLRGPQNVLHQFLCRDVTRRCQ